MSLTMEQIRHMLIAGGITPMAQNVVETGKLTKSDGTQVDYELHHGWDIAKALMCDQHWGAFNVKLMDFINAQSYDDETLEKVLAGIQMDDRHWRWFDKAGVFNTSHYNWFFLIAENYPQGACVTFHPKNGVLETGNIFYVEYIAAAPWNRENPMADRKFKGVGSALIKCAINHAHKNLKLRYGFSLHALPKAIKYYEKIGMDRHPPSDKPPLPYFEMLEQTASKFAGA